MKPQGSNHSPLVSVILCSYNGEEFLEQTLKSLSCQTYKNFEIVAIDDGSHDRTKTILEKAAKSDERIRFFQQENRGLANARNAALKKARGEWIAVIDQDDLCYPSRLQDQLTFAQNNKDVRFFFCDVDYIDKNNKIVGSHINNFPMIPKDIKKVQAANLLLRLGCFVASQGFFIHKTLIDEAGSLDESLTYVCDYDYFIKLGFLADFIYTGKSLSAWRLHPNQATKKNANKTAELIKVYKKFALLPKVKLSVRWLLFRRIIRLSLSVLKKNTLNFKRQINFIPKFLIQTTVK